MKPDTSMTTTIGFRLTTINRPTSGSADAPVGRGR